jgi:hypothetical protein
MRNTPSNQMLTIEKQHGIVARSMAWGKLTQLASH